jgi:hypothetical protein
VLEDLYLTVLEDLYLTVLEDLNLTVLEDLCLRAAYTFGMLRRPSSNYAAKALDIIDLPCAVTLGALTRELYGNPAQEKIKLPHVVLVATSAEVKEYVRQNAKSVTTDKSPHALSRIWNQLITPQAVCTRVCMHYEQHKKLLNDWSLMPEQTKCSFFVAWHQIVIPGQTTIIHAVELADHSQYNHLFRQIFTFMNKNKISYAGSLMALAIEAKALWTPLQIRFNDQVAKAREHLPAFRVCWDVGQEHTSLHSKPIYRFGGVLRTLIAGDASTEYFYQNGTKANGDIDMLVESDVSILSNRTRLNRQMKWFMCTQRTIVEPNSVSTYGLFTNYGVGTAYHVKDIWTSTEGSSKKHVAIDLFHARDASQFFASSNCCFDVNTLVEYNGLLSVRMETGKQTEDVHRLVQEAHAHDHILLQCMKHECRTTRGSLHVLDVCNLVSHVRFSGYSKVTDIARYHHMIHVRGWTTSFRSTLSACSVRPWRMRVAQAAQTTVRKHEIDESISLVTGPFPWTATRELYNASASSDVHSYKKVLTTVLCKKPQHMTHAARMLNLSHGNLLSWLTHLRPTPFIYRIECWSIAVVVLVAPPAVVDNRPLLNHLILFFSSNIV